MYVYVHMCMPICIKLSLQHHLLYNRYKLSLILKILYLYRIIKNKLNLPLNKSKTGFVWNYHRIYSLPSFSDVYWLASWKIVINTKDYKYEKMGGLIEVPALWIFDSENAEHVFLKLSQIFFMTNSWGYIYWMRLQRGSQLKVPSQLSKMLPDSPDFWAVYKQFK